MSSEPGRGGLGRLDQTLAVEVTGKDGQVEGIPLPSNGFRDDCRTRTRELRNWLVEQASGSHSATFWGIIVGIALVGILTLAVHLRNATPAAPTPNPDVVRRLLGTVMVLTAGANQTWRPVQRVLPRQRATCPATALGKTVLGFGHDSTVRIQDSATFSWHPTLDTVDWTLETGRVWLSIATDDKLRLNVPNGVVLCDGGTVLEVNLHPVGGDQMHVRCRRGHVGGSLQVRQSPEHWVTEELSLSPGQGAAMADYRAWMYQCPPDMPDDEWQKWNLTYPSVASSDR